MNMPVRLVVSIKKMSASFCLKDGRAGDRGRLEDSLLPVGAGGTLINGSGGQRDMSEKCYYLSLMNSSSWREGI